MKALFDPEGRRKLAHTLVWGSGTRLQERRLIERNIERALKRLSEKVTPCSQDGTGTLTTK